MDQFPPQLIELVQRQLSQFGRVGSTKIYQTPEVPTAITSPGMGGGSTFSGPQTIQWREPGTVIAMYGQELSGTVAMFAATAVRVQIGGQEDLFTDGQTGVFVPFLELFGPNTNWFPLLRRVTPGVNWVMTYRNQSTTTDATPSTGFAFIADADIGRAAPPNSNVRGAYRGA